MDTDPPMLPKAPSLDPAWLAHEATLTDAPTPSTDPLVRQTQYATACRARNNALLAPGARDHYLTQGITTSTLTIPSSKDGHPIPVLQYIRTSTSEDATPPQHAIVLIYYHGGGLTVGEPDSEDLSCRRLVLAPIPPSTSITLYSVGYRLKPQHPAQTSVNDSIDAFTALAQPNQPTTKTILIGSSSGGQLAALVTLHALTSSIPIHGVLLRCPVTSDSFGGGESAYVPARFRAQHTSARDPSFRTSLLARLDMDGPRDGLLRMPLEAGVEEVRGWPRTWVQVCTNDVLYSDGACFVRLLRDAGVEVRSDVVVGWPHTFWLKAPELERAVEAEGSMVEGLKWVVGFEE